MAHLDQSSSPVLRTAARLHPDEAGIAIGEVLKKRRALNKPIHDLNSLWIDSVNLHHVFCDVYTNDRMRHDGYLPVSRVSQQKIHLDQRALAYSSRSYYRWVRVVHINQFGSSLPVAHELQIDRIPSNDAWSV